MALFNSLDTVQPLIELTRAMVQSPEGPLTAATRQDRALANLGLTAGAAAINAETSGLRGVVTIPDATPYAVLIANSGKTHLIVNQTANITINLPAVTTAGQEYLFIPSLAAAEAQNWIIVAAAGHFVRGGLAFVDNDAGAGADEMHAGVYGNGTSHLTTTIVTPAAGTWVSFVSDGTLWHVNGWINSATVPTIA